MKICNKEHEEIVIDGGPYSDCPICEQIKELQSTIEMLEEKVQELTPI